MVTDSNHIFCANVFFVLVLFRYYFDPSTVAIILKYCDSHLFVCLSVCLSVRLHISKIARPNFTKFSVHVSCGRG